MGEARIGRVVVVGSFNVDHVWTCTALPRPGETLSGEYLSGPGGKGFNQATAAARAGAATTFVCALGEDVGAQWARALAVADGIDLRDQRCAAPTGTAGIYVDGDGRNCIVIGAGANGLLAPEFVAGQTDALGHAAVVLGQLESPLEAIARAMMQARAGGALAMLNPAPANVPVPDTLWTLVDVATPNETEFCAHLQRRTGEVVAADALPQLADAQLHGLCRRLLPHGTVVITLGAAGCFVSHAATALRSDTRDHYRIAAAPVQPIDTTGAGDAFNGALAAALSWRGEAAFIEHVRYATRYAGLSTERAGAAMAMPHDAEVRARFGD